MATPLKIIVLAGSYQQYQNYLFEKRVGTKEAYDYVYGGNIFAILRVKASKVEIHGTFWDREDAKELYDHANSRVVVNNTPLPKVKL